MNGFLNVSAPAKAGGYIGISGSFIPLNRFPKKEFFIPFIIFRVWAYCFKSWFTCCTLVPLPLAMRFLRLPLMI